jgi:hypothetical protein
VADVGVADWLHFRLGVVLRWVGDLWDCWGICYLQSWWGYVIYGLVCNGLSVYRPHKKSLVWWSVSLSWYMNYRGLTECVQASTPTAASAYWSTPLPVLIESLVRCPLLCWMRGCFVILLPILRWSTSIRVDVVHRPRVIMLIFIVTRSWGFIWLWDFPLLLEFVEVLDLRLAELCELFIELWHCLWSLSD